MLLPAALVAVSLTVYFPAVEYLCVGFFAVEDVPSPKFHFQEVGDPVLLSVKETLNGAFPDVEDAENAATGIFEVAVTVI